MSRNPIHVIRAGSQDDLGMSGLSASELADLVGVTAAELDRLVDLGILVARDSTGPFLETDVQKVRLAVACEQAGLPMDGFAAAIRGGDSRRPAVVRVPGGRPVPQMGGALGADLPGGERGDRDPLEVLGGALE